MLITKKHIIAIVFLLLSVGAVFSGCAKETVAQNAGLMEETFTTPTDVNYETVEAAYGDYVVSAIGNVSAVYLQKAELSWDKSGSRFNEVLVEKGQEVKKGDVLITFTVESSKADLVELYLQRERKWDAYLEGKEKRLAEIEAAKQKAQLLSSYDQQIENLKIEKLQAQYDAYVFETTRSVYAIDDKIREKEAVIEDNALIAPFDGVIDKVSNVYIGAETTSGQVLITMHSTENMLLQAKGAASDLRYNMPVTIVSGRGATAKYHSGRVVVAPNVLPSDVSSDQVLIKLDEDIKENDLSKQISYQANKELLQNVLLVPQGALNMELGKNFVHVLEGENVETKYVVVRYTRNSDIWVMEGISDGQVLVVD